MAIIFLVEYSMGWVTTTGVLQKSITPASFWGEFLYKLVLFF
jgi:hypothetical protein